MSPRENIYRTLEGESKRPVLRWSVISLKFSMPASARRYNTPIHSFLRQISRTGSTDDGQSSAPASHPYNRA